MEQDKTRAPSAQAAGADGSSPAEKREVRREEKKGLQIRDILLIGILLAAGAVLKFFVGTIINFGMKPNFIIAMYCLTILLIKPGVVEAAIIGILSGAVCQFAPGFPFINLVSELIGAVVMALLIRIPLGTNNLLARTGKTVVATFLSTLFSGFSFVGAQYIVLSITPVVINGVAAKPTALAAFIPIIFGTATINAIIVHILFVPLRLVLGKKT